MSHSWHRRRSSACSSSPIGDEGGTGPRGGCGRPLQGLGGLIRAHDGDHTSCKFRDWSGVRAGTRERADRRRPISVGRGSDSNVASGAAQPLLSLGYAPGVDPPRLYPKHLVVEVRIHRFASGMKDLCLTSHFDAPWPPRLDRCEVVHDESHLRVLVNVTPLLPLGKVVSAYVDRVVLRVVAKRQRNDVGLTVKSGGRQPAQALAVQVFDLLRGEYAHRCSPFALSRMIGMIRSVFSWYR